MFKDIDISRENYSRFAELHPTDADGEPIIEGVVFVLSGAAWPSYKDIPMTFPPIIGSWMSKFENHYISRHNGRRLAWKHFLSHGIVVGNFRKVCRALLEYLVP